TNYLAFFSGDTLGDVSNDYYGANPSRRAAFGLNRGARLTDITDGTSNTMLMAEYLTGTTNDARGDYSTAQGGGGILMTRVTPNSSAPDVIVGWDDNWCPAGSNLPQQNLPCAKSVSWSDISATARSRHNGGVNILRGDGSVYFISQNID